MYTTLSLYETLPPKYLLGKRLIMESWLALNLFCISALNYDYLFAFTSLVLGLQACVTTAGCVTEFTCTAYETHLKGPIL